MTYPLSTPRTRLSMKNEPKTMRGTKYIQLNDEPRASLVYKTEWKFIMKFINCFIKFHWIFTTAKNNIESCSIAASLEHLVTHFLIVVSVSNGVDQMTNYLIRWKRSTALDGTKITSHKKLISASSLNQIHCQLLPSFDNWLLNTQH